MPVYQSEAIALKQFDLGEADKIITFYSKDMGKIRAVASGARKSNSRISGLVLPFTYNKLIIYRGRSIDRIKQIENIYSFSLLRENLNKIAYATYMAEIIDKVGLEGDPNEELFSLLISSYYHLLKVDEKKLDNINLVFKLSLLNILGYRPELNICTICNKNNSTCPSNFFSISRGGIVCRNCIKKADESLVNISGETLEIMKRIQTFGFNSLKNLILSPKACRNMDELLDLFIEYHLELKIKSLDFLHMIRNLG
jgi:DNA repair protein RecO (recombination protein O)